MDKRQNIDLDHQEPRLARSYDVVPYGSRRRHSLSVVGAKRVIGVTAGLLIAITAGWLMGPSQVRWPLGLTPSVQSDSFRRAVNRAMSAAELTQTAATQEEWQTVVQWWEEAIALMAAVAPENPNHALAQAKVEEYSRNVAYARQQMSQPNIQQTASMALWSTGSVKEQVIQAQGNPTRSVRYDPLCQEVLYYGDSTVELTNGTVSDYRDVDGKFRVSAQAPETRLITGATSAWTLGSSREDVFRIQGTPSRVENLNLPDLEVLYYGSSSITLLDGEVVGYHNAGSNLKLSVAAIATPPDRLQQSSWSLGSSRGDVLQIQGIPTQVVSDRMSCSEVFYYGNSSVEFRNGSVSAYDNAGGNLEVIVR